MTVLSHLQSAEKEQVKKKQTQRSKEWECRRRLAKLSDNTGTLYTSLVLLFILMLCQHRHAWCSILKTREINLQCYKYWNSSDLPVDPLSDPPPSSIRDQLGVDFPLDPPSATASRLSAGIGEWRIPPNLVNERTRVKSVSFFYISFCRTFFVEQHLTV